MLEKIGLPAKPSMKGANWVIDASHCQGCSCQFTMFNRKHHCRRCGGIFCNSCSQQRMVLRGQGDSPVRICDPCKKLEEAARFELRYGHKNRITKGSSKLVLKTDDELLLEISGTADGKHLMPSQNKPHILLDSPSSSTVPENTGEGRIDGLADSESSSPEDLRRQAAEEKKRFKVLKAEGKADEALKAFKHGKELERQAGALEISMRKSRKMSGKLSNIGGIEKKLISLEKSEVKEDIFSELRQLGWSDADLRDADKMPARPSLEGELSTLISEAVQKKGNIDKTEVIVLKRKALLLKREGKLAEAKEELKQAKMLEKQLEEQELLGDDSASEDELYNLIRNMGDDDHQGDLVLKNNAHFDEFLSSVDLPMDVNLEVTEDDMIDPELSHALRLFGWSEDEHEQNDEELSQKRAGNATETMALLKKAKISEQGLKNIQPSASSLIVVPKSKMQVQKELLVLKKKALTLRREGRIEDANEELRKGEKLEQQLEELENTSMKAATLKPVDLKFSDSGDIRVLDLGFDGVESDVTEQDMHDPAMLSALKNLGWIAEESNPAIHTPLELPSKSVRNKVEIRRDLLVIKRKALSLRRQGMIEEAEGELEKAKDLENLLSKIDEAAKRLQTPDLGQNIISENILKGDDNELVLLKPETPSSITVKSNGSKEEILALKRKALALKREGKLMEAKEVLSKAKLLEKSLEVVRENNIVERPSVLSESIGPHSSKPISSHDRFKLQQESLAHKRNALKLRREGKIQEADIELEKAKELEIWLEELGPRASSSGSAIDTDAAEDFLDPQIISALKSIGWDDKDLASNGREKSQSSSLKERVVDQPRLERTCLEEQIKDAKIRALNLKRAGKQEEALEALRESKKLEKKLQLMN